jgi:hypothetical protein
MGAIENLCVVQEGRARPHTAEVVCGVIARVDASGTVWVDYPDNPLRAALVAICTTHVDAAQVGLGVALMFVQNDPAHPVLIGLLRQGLTGTSSHPPGQGREARATAGRTQIDADTSLTLRCGEASLTLNRDGRVIIRGSHIAHYAQGTVRLRGAIVELN